MPLVRASPDNGSSDPASATILVVEDEVLIRATLAEFLRESGYRVFETVDVAEAKAVLSAGTPVDLVFSDVIVPGEENGYALARWVRQHHPELPVLLTSGFADPKDKGDLPADIAVLHKPYILDLVLQRIQLLLRPARTARS